MMNKENYGIRDFIVDCNNDIAKVRLCIETVSSVRTFFRNFSLVWSYISILLFAFYGVYQGYTTGLWTFSIIVFSICGVMLITNTVLLCLRSHDKDGEYRRTSALHVFRWIAVFLKLAMSIVTVYNLITMPDNGSMTYRAVICVVSIFWLGVTLTVDLVFFLFSLFGRILRNIVEERVDRVKAITGRVTEPVRQGVELAQHVLHTISPRRLVERIRTKSKKENDKEKEKEALPSPDESQEDKPTEGVPT